MSSPAQPQPQTAQLNVQIPQVSLNDAKGFSQVWNKGGISVILDATTLEFARDFANIVLRSFVIDQVNKAQQARMAAEAAAKAEPTNSGIIITE